MSLNSGRHVDRDAEFIFFALMEYEKYCMASTEGSTGESTFLSNVVSKFTVEGYNTLKKYLVTLPDSATVLNLLSKSQRIVEAGSVVGRKALEASDDTTESTKLLRVRACVFFCCGGGRCCISLRCECRRLQRCLHKERTRPHFTRT